MKTPHRWTQDQVTRLVTLLRQEGGVTLAAAAKDLGLRPEQVSAKATEARRRLEPEIQVPKFKRAAGDRTRKTEAWWDEVKERVEGGGEVPAGMPSTGPREGRP